METFCLAFYFIAPVGVVVPFAVFYIRSIHKALQGRQGW